MTRLRPAGLVLAALLLLSPSAAAQINFVPQYNDGAGEGFNDPSLGASRKAAFEFTLSRISSYFTNRYAGETIVVGAQFNPLGGTSTSAVLASAGPSNFYTGVANLPVAGVYYATALANHRSLTDQNNSTVELSIQFNSDVDNATVLGSTNWYYGTNGAPGIHVDMVSVAMHELTHGLGFTGLMNSSGQYNGGGGQLAIYDHFMNSDATGGTKLRNLTQAQRAAEANGNDLWWDGPLGTAGNANVRPKLYAPTTFSSGSSLYHLDETVHGGELMSPFYSGVDHDYSAMELGMLADMGWTLAPVPEPAGLVLLAATAGGVAWVRRRRVAIDGGLRSA